MENKNRLINLYWSFCRDNFALALSLHSVVFYLICHLLAYFYFVKWGVNYLAFADANTILSFALQKPLTVFLATILVPFYFFLVVFTIVDWFGAPDKSYNKPHLYVIRARIVTISLWFALGAFGVLNIYGFDKPVIDDFKLGKTPYYTVNYADGKLDCVFPLGYVGDYVVFKKSDFSTIYVKRLDISNIELNQSTTRSICPLK
jgi:hypothetical protein